MRVLVTGATGFLGRRLCAYLCSAGLEVIAVVRRSSDGEQMVSLDEALDFVCWDLKLGLPAQLRDCPLDAVIHAACSYGAGGAGMSDAVSLNLFGAVSLLEASLSIASGRGIHFFNIGTALVAGVNSYSLSKAQFVDWGRLAVEHSLGKLCFVNLKAQTMYGYESVPSRFTSEVFHSCVRGKGALKLTSGEQERDFVHVDDVVSAIAFLLGRCALLEGFVELEVGSGTSLSVRHFVETVHRESGAQVGLEFGAIPMRLNEQMRCSSDISVISRMGWMPKFSISQGVKNVLDSFLK